MARVYLNGKGYRRPKTVFHKRYRSEREKQWDDYFKCVKKCQKEREMPTTFCELGCRQKHLRHKPRI